MGQRIARLTESKRNGSDIGWCVYQSTAMACFDPIFDDQLSAILFARALELIYPQWDSPSQGELQTEVLHFMRHRYTNQHTDYESIDAYWSDMADTENVWADFLDWRAKKKEKA